MASNQLNKILSIKMKSSLGKQVLIVLPHMIIILILVIFVEHNNAINGLSIIFLLLSLVSIILSLIYFVRLHLTFHLKKSIFTIYKSSNDNWSLGFKDGFEEGATIESTSFVSNLLIIVNFKSISENQYTALISADSVDHDEFRKLKVFLKTKHWKA